MTTSTADTRVVLSFIEMEVTGCYVAARLYNNHVRLIYPRRNAKLYPFELIYLETLIIHAMFQAANYHE